LSIAGLAAPGRLAPWKNQGILLAGLKGWFGRLEAGISARRLGGEPCRLALQLPGKEPEPARQMLFDQRGR
jgi:hypothetical protein